MIFLALVLALVPPAAANVREELRPLGYLAGQCWTGTFPDGKSTDTHCFEVVFDGQFLRDRHTVNGAKQPYAGETLYAWDPKKKQITYTYWASDGGVSTGVANAEGESTITFPEEYVSDKGTLTIHNVWTRINNDTYEVVSKKKAGAEWQEMWRMTMRRVK
jgi:hypothetical protein